MDDNFASSSKCCRPLRRPQLLQTKINPPRSCRQGSPISPLLFVITMEPLAISIRNHPSIAPLILGKVDRNISLYVDDVALFLCFWLYYKLGEKCIPASNRRLDTICLKNLPFKIFTDKMKYLGVISPRDPKLIYKLNFLDMIEKVQSNINSWRLLPLSMTGCVNTINMIALPRFLYL